MTPPPATTTEIQSTVPPEDELALDSFKRLTRWGIGLAWCSAIFYTMANTSLRQVVDANPIWVSCIKAFPTLVMVLPWCLWRWSRSLPLLSRWSDIGWIFLGACSGQFIGNCMFQWSLGRIGMALAVPVTLGSVLIGSAILGGWMLGERVTLRSWISIFILVLAVFVLSCGAGQALQAIQVDGDVKMLDVVAGVGGVFVAGIAFSITGVTIGRTAANGLPAPTILLTASLVGVVGLWLLVIALDGWQVIAETTPRQWSWALAAGIFNGLAFISLTLAIHMIGLLNVNALNASQTAISAIVGVLLFSEPLTVSLVGGVALTIVGLLAMPGPRQTGIPSVNPQRQ